MFMRGQTACTCHVASSKPSKAVISTMVDPLPEPVGDGDHHVVQRPLACHPGILVKDQGQALPPQDLGLAKEHTCSAVQMAADFCIRCALQRSACSADSIVEAH